MPYRSVDALQRTLADTVFQYAADRKKAVGRALGTLVEIITYYTLRAWGLRDSIVIERMLAEFSNPDITHNVEFSLHPVLWATTERFLPTPRPLSVARLRKGVPKFGAFQSSGASKANQLLTSDGLVRNACVLLEDELGPSWPTSTCDQVMSPM